MTKQGMKGEADTLTVVTLARDQKRENILKAMLALSGDSKTVEQLFC